MKDWRGPAMREEVEAQNMDKVTDLTWNPSPKPGLRKTPQGDGSYLSSVTCSFFACDLGIAQQVTDSGNSVTTNHEVLASVRFLQQWRPNRERPERLPPTRTQQCASVYGSVLRTRRFPLQRLQPQPRTSPGFGFERMLTRT